jgi:hypothetical protein
MTLEANLAICSLCPRLCRPVCPVAVGTAREAAVPSLIAATLIDWQRGRISGAIAEQAATLCTDCGACEQLCHLHRPLPALLREARGRLLPSPPMEPLREIEGDAELLFIETDDRPAAEALARRLAQPVARLLTRDQLGVQAIEHAPFAERATQLRARLADRAVIVADGGVARALTAAGVPFTWLHVRVPALGVIGSCSAPGEAPPLACCGAGGPLPAHQPDAATDVAAAWWRRTADHDAPLADTRCAAHLRHNGFPARDAVDRLLGAD